MQRNISTVPIHPVGTPRNSRVLLLADAKNRFDCTNSTCRHTAKFTHVFSSMQRNVSTVPIQPVGTPRNLHVLMQTSVSTVRTHHRHTGAATTFQNPFPLGLPATTANGNDFYRREYHGTSDRGPLRRNGSL